jgi:hypothetical protein
MAKITYEIVQHDGGWAYRVDETFSEPFPSHDSARKAAEQAGPLSAKLLKHGILKTYKGFPHGMLTTQADTINADILAFIKS